MCIAVHCTYISWRVRLTEDIYDAPTTSQYGLSRLAPLFPIVSDVSTVSTLLGAFGQQQASLNKDTK